MMIDAERVAGGGNKMVSARQKRKKRAWKSHQLQRSTDTMYFISYFAGVVIGYLIYVVQS